MLYFGENAKVVLTLVNDFIALKEAIKPELVPNRRNLYAFSDLVVLSEIIEKFIVNSNFDQKKIFDKITDDYNAKDGVKRFIDYRKVLEEEKSKYGFQNFCYLLKEAEKK